MKFTFILPQITPTRLPHYHNAVGALSASLKEAGQKTSLLHYIKPVSEKELKILPATGGAVEDLQHPDQDEIEDALINRDAAEITAFAEVPEPDISHVYRPTPPLFRQEKHL